MVPWSGDPDTTKFDGVRAGREARALVVGWSPDQTTRRDRRSPINLVTFGRDGEEVMNEPET
jgi:hypothetical protein